MALLSLITEQSTVPCFSTIQLFLGDNFDKKNSGDHFRVGDHIGVGIISGAVQHALLTQSNNVDPRPYSRALMLCNECFIDVVWHGEILLTQTCLLTIRPVALSGYRSIAHEGKPNGLLSYSLKVLSSSGIRGTKFIPVYNFPAQ